MAQKGPKDSMGMDHLSINGTVSSCSPRAHPPWWAPQNRTVITHKTGQEWWAGPEPPLCLLPLPQRWHIWFLHKSLALNVGILPFRCSIKGDVINFSELQQMIKYFAQTALHLNKRSHHAQHRTQCFICVSKAAKKAFEKKDTFKL